MLFDKLIVSFFLGSSLPLHSLAYTGSWKDHEGHNDDCETVDVAIIGGGSSGTYSAVRLFQEGKTVAVIEKQDRLGGSVATFVDRETGQTNDYGVILFHNSSIVNNFFQFLHEPLIVDTFGNTTTKVANFRTGQILPPGPPPNIGDIAAAIEHFLTLKLPSGFGYEDVPQHPSDDILLPLPTFLTKHNISALGPLIAQTTLGSNLLQQPAIYALKILNPSFLQALEAGFLTTANHDNQQAFDRARDYLGSQVYLDSVATRVTRHKDSVSVTVRTPKGTKNFRASHLLITMPPLLSDLQTYLDLTKEESSLFAQFQNNTFAGAIIHNAGIPEGTAVVNVDPAQPFGAFDVPGLTAYQPDPIEGFTTVYYVDIPPHQSSDMDIKQVMLSQLAKVKKLFRFPLTSAEPRIVSYLRHSPFQQHVPAAAIKDGFYHELVSLQGTRRTYWTGAAWSAHDSSTIWSYTEQSVLPHLLE